MQPSVSTISPNLSDIYAQRKADGTRSPQSDSKKHFGSDSDKAQADLSRAELQSVQQLQVRDQEVRAHEQAHLGAAGNLAIGGANFTYATGPDGKRYAIGGEVSIDISDVPGDPEATLRKAETIRRAALAPTNPSAQDKRVASRATAMANQAKLELFQQQTETEKSDSDQGSRLDITA